VIRVIFGILFFFSTFLIAGVNPHPIPAKIQKQMKRAGSWKPGCPVPLRDLSYLRLPYIGFDGKRHTGELIVHRTVAMEIRQIFDELFKVGYPIHQMKLVSIYNANDSKSIDHDNTSAFNCRPVTGGKKWSNHSYGKAVDINPIENPYINRRGYIRNTYSRKEYGKTRIRRHYDKSNPNDFSVILPEDKIVNLFKKYGWRWGGDWHSIKDYQHFEKNVQNRSSAILKHAHKKPQHKISPRKLFQQLY
jgi:hypothetical protein